MRHRPSRSHGLSILPVMALALLGCRPGGGSATATPEDEAARAPDPTGQSGAEEGELAPDYADRRTPYDAYVAEAHLRVGLRVHDPAELSRMWSAFTRAHGVASLDVTTLVREGLYAMGVPGEVLEAVDPSGSWGIELDYPLRSYAGLSWAYVPSLPDKASALADAVVGWLDMQPMGNGTWHAPPLDGGEASIALESLPTDQKGEGSYLGKMDGGVMLGLREAAVASAPDLTRKPATRVALLELKGFETVVPDLLEEFEFTLHHPERAQWKNVFESLDRAYLSLDRLDEGHRLEVELGAEGQLAALDPGFFGPARPAPVPLARLMPGDAFVAATLSWGNPTDLAQVLRAGTRGPGTAALEREFGDWSDAFFDRGVEDLGVAIYVDDRGQHSVMVALPGLSPRGMKDSADTLMALGERTLRSLEASLVAREASGEMSKEAFEEARMPYSSIELAVRGAGKAKAIELELTEELQGNVEYLADDEGKFLFTAFEYKGAFFFVMGPGTKQLLRRFGRGSLADMPGMRGAHAAFGGCQVCGVINGQRAAASIYGRHRKGMTPERRKEAEGMLSKLSGGGQSPMMMRVEPGRVRLGYHWDLSVIAEGEARQALWETFMTAIGARGETLRDPREWLFG